jgi:signal transduction histidine kinase
LQLISNIIELSKLQSGEAELKIEDLSVSDSIRNFEDDCQMLKEALDCEDLFVKYEVKDTLTYDHFKGNQEAFKQIMSCLVENAFKFTNEGGITIGVEEHDDQFVKFYVSDTGIGIDETEIHDIFNCFRQGSMATHRLYRGTGLGLGLAKALVEELGGSIWAESKIEEGSRFSFTLKLARNIPTVEMHRFEKEDSASKSTKVTTASAG